MYGEVRRILNNLARKGLLVVESGTEKDIFPNVELIDDGEYLIATLKFRSDVDEIMQRIVKNFNDRGMLCVKFSESQFGVKYNDILREIDDCFKKYK